MEGLFCQTMGPENNCSQQKHGSVVIKEHFQFFNYFNCQVLIEVKVGVHILNA